MKAESGKAKAASAKTAPSIKGKPVAAPAAKPATKVLVKAAVVAAAPVNKKAPCRLKVQSSRCLKSLWRLKIQSNRRLAKLCRPRLLSRSSPFKRQ